MCVDEAGVVFRYKQWIVIVVDVVMILHIDSYSKLLVATIYRHSKITARVLPTAGRSHLKIRKTETHNHTRRGKEGVRTSAQEELGLLAFSPLRDCSPR